MNERPETRQGDRQEIEGERRRRRESEREVQSCTPLRAFPSDKKPLPLSLPLNSAGDGEEEQRRKGSDDARQAEKETDVMCDRHSSRSLSRVCWCWSLPSRFVWGRCWGELVYQARLFSLFLFILVFQGNAALSCKEWVVAFLTVYRVRGRIKYSSSGHHDPPLKRARRVLR